MNLGFLLDPFRGKAITIPPMDGALRPNALLDEASPRLIVQEPDNLVRLGNRVLFSSGSSVLALPPKGAMEPAAVKSFEAPVSALAASQGGGLAAGLDDGRIEIVEGPHAGKTVPRPGRSGTGCPTSLAFAGEDTLIVCHGSSAHRPSDWVADLMSNGTTGSVWRIDLRTGGQTCLADSLAFPNGLIAGSEAIVVAESWRHRLVSVPLTGAGTPKPLLTKLPGYPSRLAPASGGGAWLAVFAPRNRLIEFVLQEHEYRMDMMREVERPFWVAPALSSGASFLEPLQCGAVRSMGIHKPWAPSRSYGLVVRLDEKMRPMASWHSRAGGTRHGVTSVTETDGRALAAVKGGNVIVELGPHASA